MVKQMQRQAMYPKRRLYCNKWQNLKAEPKWQCSMGLSAKERHKYHLALCKWLQHNCSPGGECNTRVVLMVCICRCILVPKSRWYVCNPTCPLGDRKHGISRQRVWGFVRAGRAVLNSWMFLTENRDLADGSAYNGCRLTFGFGCVLLFWLLFVLQFWFVFGFWLQLQLALLWLAALHCMCILWGL
jgi:hypothetical protein